MSRQQKKLADAPNCVMLIWKKINENLTFAVAENQRSCKNCNMAMSMLNSTESKNHPVTEFKGCQEINHNKLLEHMV